MDYYVSLFDGEFICLENHCFFDRKSDAIDFFNQVIDEAQSKSVCPSPVKSVELRHDNVVLAEVEL